MKNISILTSGVGGLDPTVYANTISDADYQKSSISQALQLEINDSDLILQRWYWFNFSSNHAPRVPQRFTVSSKSSACDG